MSNTGARPDQIEAAARAMFADEKKRHGWLHSFEAAGPWRTKAVANYASYLCPVGSALIDADDVAAVKLVTDLVEAVNRWRQTPVGSRDADGLLAIYADRVTPDVLDRLRRIGGGDAGERGGA